MVSVPNVLVTDEHPQVIGSMGGLPELAPSRSSL
jgi:hypothetical protein